MKHTKKILAFLLALVLTVTLAPVSQASAAPKMKLSKARATVYVGKTIKLKVKNNKTKKKVKWKSTNKKVATVNKKGKVRAKKAGKATIIAKIGNKKLKCKITVKNRKTTVPTTTKAATVAPTKAPAVETTKPASTEVKQTTQAPTTTQKATTQAPTTTQKATTQAATTTQKATTQATTTTQAPTTASNVSSGAASYNWDSVTYLEGEVANQYKVVVAEGDVNEIVNIQTPGFAAETGIYVTFPDANLGEMTVNGTALGKSVEGAGVIMHLSSFTSTYNEVVIKNSDGSLKAKLYVYNNSGQTTPTQGAVTTAAQQTPTTAQQATTAVQNDGAYAEDSTIAKPFGLVVSSKANNTVTVVWGYGDIDLYNVYIDGVRVKEGVVCASYVIENVATGTHTVSVATVVGNKESSRVSATVEVAGSGSTVATTAATATTNSQATTNSSSSSSGASSYNWSGVAFLEGEAANQYKAVAVEGNVSGIVNIQTPGFAAETGIYVTFPDADLGEMTVNGTTLSKSVEGAGVVMHLSNFTSTYSEVIVKNSDGTVKAKIYVYNAGVGTQTTTAAQQTTTAVQQTTTAAQQTTTTKQPTTTATPQETTTITFTTNSSIAQPFGLVVSSSENGYVTIVWGAGDINCYNVYVDGERRRTGIKAQSLTLPVYFEGTHKIEIATVVGTTESIRISESITIAGIGEKETEPETCPEELKPQLRSDLSLRDDRILMQLNNKTNGKYSDSQIYWCLVGYNANNQLCYMDKDGNLIPANTGMNNVTINGRNVANVCYTLADASYVYVPSIKSGRMYLSYEKPIYLTFNQAADGTIGFAGPDLNNTSDPNADTLFEFAEFTIDGKYYWGNTTRVDYFSFPMITRLIGHTQYETFDKVVGDIGTRDEIFAAFKANAPEAFKTLVTDKRILAPCKSTFNVGGTYANYFDSYINEFWSKYTNEDLVFQCEGGTFTGRVNGDKMYFTRSGDGTVYTVSKPTTQDVLEGKGAFASGNSTELVIEAQLCAAFNRGVATEPTKWNKPQYYYQNSVNNYYAGFFHEHGVVGLAYGFCYDDVNDQSTLLQYDSADALVIDLKW